MKPSESLKTWLWLLGVFVAFSVLFSLTNSSIVPAVSLLSTFLVATLVYLVGVKYRRFRNNTSVTIGFLLIGLPILIIALATNRVSTSEFIGYLLLIILTANAIYYLFRSIIWIERLIYNYANNRNSRNTKFFSARNIQYCIKDDDGWSNWITSNLSGEDGYFTLSKGRTITTFNAAELRWIKQSQGEVTLDLNIDRVWLSLKLRMTNKEGKQLESMLDEMAATQGISIKRNPGRRLDHITARPAIQDLHGAWTLNDAVTLYLTPAYLVIIQNDYVQHEIAVNNIENVTTLPRVDAPDDDKLVSFVVDDEEFTFAMPKAETFATTLAQASRSPLEEADAQKKKHENNEPVNKSNRR